MRENRTGSAGSAGGAGSAVPDGQPIGHADRQPGTPSHDALPGFDASPALLWALGLVFTLIWFAMLGARTLVPTDEGRYAEMAREMLATGDWITTRLNGIKYFEKPPLQI